MQRSYKIRRELREMMAALRAPTSRACGFERIAREQLAMWKIGLGHSRDARAVGLCLRARSAHASVPNVRRTLRRAEVSEALPMAVADDVVLDIPAATR